MEKGRRMGLAARGSVVILGMVLSACGAGSGAYSPLSEWLSLQPLTAEAAFELTGTLDAVTPSSLVIDGREVSVSGSTWLSPDLAVGQTVELVLLVLPDGSLTALTVEPTLEGGQPGEFELTGAFTASEGSLWTVGGLGLAIANSAEIESGIAVGATLHVEGTIGADGQFIVTEVSLAGAQEEAEDECGETEDEDEAGDDSDEDVDTEDEDDLEDGDEAAEEGDDDGCGDDEEDQGEDDEEEDDD